MQDEVETKELLREMRDLLRENRDKYDALMRQYKEYRNTEKKSAYINWLIFGMTVVAAGVYIAEFLIRLQFQGK